MPHRKLLHISHKGHYQFVTFRTKESLDSHLKRLYRLDVEERIRQYKMDMYLDTSVNGTYFYDDVLSVAKAYIHEKDSVLYDLVSYAVMPNHIHILFKETEELSKAVGFLKGGLAHNVNQYLGRKGKFWSSDYYNRLIRDEKHFEVVYNYIHNNPVKAGLKDAEERYFGIYG